MPKPRTLTLDEVSRQQLMQHRDHDRRAYVRERAAALLKIADGASPAEVARSGLLRGRKEDTVYTWLNRYVESGPAGLLIGKGRGRKPAFSPSVPRARGRQRSALARGTAGPAPMRRAAEPLAVRGSDRAL